MEASYLKYTYFLIYPKDKHCLVLVYFMPLCVNNVHAAIAGISTLILEGYTDFFTASKNFQKKNILIEKNSAQHCIKQKVKASLSSHITPRLA